jgi:hypothetical protein
MSRRANRKNPSRKSVRTRTRSARPSDLEKGFYIAVLSFAVALTALLAHGASYGASSWRSVSSFHHATIAPLARSRGVVFSRAMVLQSHFDSRPYWHSDKLVPGVPTSQAMADLAIEHLIPCESGGRTVDTLDTNGKTSYGILQFQDWSEWERMSGIKGDPDNSDDAIRMAEWGIEHGMIDHWGCARILGEM